MLFSLVGRPLGSRGLLPLPWGEGWGEGVRSIVRLQPLTRIASAIRPLPKGEVIDLTHSDSGRGHAVNIITIETISCTASRAACWPNRPGRWRCRDRRATHPARALRSRRRPVPARPARAGYRFALRE